MGLQSTGFAVESMAEWVEAPEGEAVVIHSSDGSSLEITTHRAVHSELCFGAVIRCEGLAIGWTADSAFDLRLYEAITDGTQLVLLDARRSGGREHASFGEIVAFVHS